MKNKLSFFVGLFVFAIAAASMGIRNSGCLEQVKINLDYITNNTNQDYCLALNSQNRLIKLENSKTIYFDKDIFVKKNVCGNLNEKLGTIYQTKNKKTQLGTLEFNIKKTDDEFNFSVTFKGDKDSVSNVSATNKNFTANMSLSLDRISADGQLQDATISLIEETIQPDILD